MNKSLKCVRFYYFSMQLSWWHIMTQYSETQIKMQIYFDLTQSNFLKSSQELFLSFHCSSIPLFLTNLKYTLH